VDPRERVLDEEETQRMIFEGLISGVWTALPGIVQAVTNGGNTLEVQPAINGRVRQLNGTYKSIPLPKLVDVPICWQGGGGLTFTFPIAAGDECLIVFASRCIDQWWKNGFTAPAGQKGADGNPVNALNDPPLFCMHDISDGFALVGVRSLPRKLTGFNATTARLRSDDNTFYFEADPVNKAINMVASGGVSINGVTVDSSGNVANAATLTSTGNITSSAGAVAAKTQVSVNGTPLTVP
jgi:protein gp138